MAEQEEKKALLVFVKGILTAIGVISLIYWHDTNPSILKDIELTIGVILIGTGVNL